MLQGADPVAGRGFAACARHVRHHSFKPFIGKEKLFLKSP
jgi:hypothetical protein